MSASYGPWITWGGGKGPVAPDTVVEAKFRDGRSISGVSKYFRWDHTGDDGDVVEYRVRDAVPAPEDASNG